MRNGKYQGKRLGNPVEMATTPKRRRTPAAEEPVMSDALAALLSDVETAAIVRLSEAETAAPQAPLPVKEDAAEPLREAPPEKKPTAEEPAAAEAAIIEEPIQEAVAEESETPELTASEVLQEILLEQPSPDTPEGPIEQAGESEETLPVTAVPPAQKTGAAKGKRPPARLEPQRGKATKLGGHRLERSMPTTDQLDKELHRERYKRNYRGTLRSTVYTLITVAAIAILTATLWLPVLQIYGSSMAPTLEEGNIVFSLKGSSFTAGDIIAFYYNNKILVKRVVAHPGEWVDIDEDGTVYVNNKELEEPYLVEKAFGDCNITLPYQVPDGKFFVIGDHRSVSIDSRNTSVGCVAEEQIVGKLVFCVWPLSAFGTVR